MKGRSLVVVREQGMGMKEAAVVVVMVDVVVMVAVVVEMVTVVDCVLEATGNSQVVVGDGWWW